MLERNYNKIILEKINEIGHDFIFNPAPPAK
jgi:hypothetical protein